MSDQKSRLVLVCDDEPRVRGTLVGMAKFLGFRVLSAADGEEAVELFRQHYGEAYALMLGVRMPPGEDGARYALDELAGELQALRADGDEVRVVLVTGMERMDISERFAAYDVRMVFTPLGLEMLRRALEA